MSLFEIYVHGTPRGHQIWGSENNHDYISGFYNHDSSTSENVMLQIDICRGDSFYTYVRQENIFDVGGRPQAFFALTVSFHKAYCTNVYKLYQLFDAVYKQICVGSILKSSGTGDRYLVDDFTKARSGTYATVDKIKAGFTQKITELIEPTLQSLTSGDTFNRSKKRVSLLEVDSPLFFDFFKKKSIIVSPNIQPAAIAYDTVVNELRQTSEQKSELSSINEGLQSRVVSLSEENESLSNQLNTSTASIERKFKNKLDNLQVDLENVTRERDSLKQKIDAATSSIELMDKPFQKLTRLLAGRFPETSSSLRGDNSEEEQKVQKKHHRPLWRSWLNSILLILILGVCCAILVFVLKYKPKEQNGAPDTSNGEVTTGITVNPNSTDSTETIGPVEGIDSTPWEMYTINIKNSRDGIVKKGQTYKVNVCFAETWKAATDIPEAVWIVDTGDNNPINTDGAPSFTVPNLLSPGTNIQIKYMYEGNPVITRTVSVE